MNYELISGPLRNILKTRNFTYKDVAAKLEMSESGVKKMLTASDIGYNKLSALLNLLELSLEDITPLGSKRLKRLTQDQEQFLLRNPKHFNFFIQLHHFGMKIEAVKKNNSKISKEKISKILEDLVRINIISIVNGNAHSMLEEGFKASKKFNERYRTIYEIVIKRLNEIDSGQWRSWMFEGFGTYSLSQKSALELRNQMQALLEEFSARSDREKKLYNPKDLVNTGTLFLNIPLKIQDVFPII